MLLKNVVYALTLVNAIGCSSMKMEETEDQNFNPTELTVELQKSGSDFMLTNEPSYDPVITKAELWCNDELKSSLEFTADNQKLELFSKVKNCELRLVEFKLDDKTFERANHYADGVYVFEYRNADNILVDNKLARSSKAIENVSYDKCRKKCKYKKAHVTFEYSILDIKKEILDNTIVYSEIKVGMEEEPAPTCDKISADLVQDEGYHALPSLVISLHNCRNTIDTTDLEFGIKKAHLTEQGYLSDLFLITDAQQVITNYPVNPEQDGYNYEITLSFDEIKSLWNSEASTIEALTTDFVLAIRNKGGISALAYAIDNRCILKHKEKH